MQKLNHQTKNVNITIVTMLMLKFSTIQNKQI